METAAHRIGVISDIHGSLVPLEIGYEFLEARGVDRIICAGDVASFGPDPNEVIEYLRANGIESVMGNEDESMLSEPEEAPPAPRASAPDTFTSRS